MVVLVPEQNQPIKYTRSYSQHVAGAESNVAIAVSKLGHNVGWINKLGNDPFGEYIKTTLIGERVDVLQVKFVDNHPTGIFFKEKKTIRGNKCLLL